MNLYEGRLGDARELLRSARQDSPQERKLRGEATLPSTDAEKRLERLVEALESLCDRADKQSGKFCCTVDVSVGDIREAIKNNT